MNVLGNQRAAVGRIAYEVKTLDPSSDVSLLYKQISRGIEQTIDRANVVDAGVLVLDKAAFDAVMASPLGTQLNEQVQRLQGVTNSSGQTKAFLRLEEGLYRDSQRSLHAIKDEISQIE